MALQGSLAPAQEAGLPPEPRVAQAAALALLLILWGAKALAPVPVVGAAALTAAVFAELWFPLSRCDRAGRGLDAVGLARGGGHLAPRPLLEALAFLALMVAAYAVGTFLWQTGHLAGLLPHAPLREEGWHLSLPPLRTLLTGRVAYHVLGQVLGVALPEETFYRGYLGPQLAHLWPSTSVAGGVVGPAACLTALAFALGHWLGEWQPARLLTFFPGLAFGLLARRQRGIWGAVLVHAGCNLFAQGWAASWVRPL